MKERPILFSAPMVQAILAGNKTQTRRVVKGFEITGPNPPSSNDYFDWYKKGEWAGAHRSSMDFSKSNAALNCPYGQIGDQLWVRENFQPLLAEEKTWDDMPYVNYKTGEGYTVSYPATDGIVEFVNADDELKDSVKPSIHMPRWASRIKLEITNIRVERLQDISRADAIAEGIRHSGLTINGISEGDHFYDYEMKIEDMCEWFTNPIASFQSLWRSINGPDSWTTNPWVWVIEFKRVERPA